MWLFLFDFKTCSQLHFVNGLNLTVLPDATFSPACDLTVMMSADEFSKVSAQTVSW